MALVIKPEELVQAVASAVNEVLPEYLDRTTKAWRTTKTPPEDSDEDIAGPAVRDIHGYVLKKVLKRMNVGHL